jgi:phosphatidylglycerol:prolipoprotein diacylglycerol transferase
MSFHGGLLGVIVALAWLARRSRLPFLAVADFTAPLVPLGLGFGRLGNFINGELPGRITEAPWGLVYPGEVLARHPSSLYQAITEGLVLFTALWFLTAKPRPLGFASGAFLLGYGLLRFSTEFFRTPDPHLGFLSLGLTMGQWLCLPMLLGGLGLLLGARRGGKPPLTQS